VRVLLAGASGAIGKLLIPRLISAGHQVVGTTRAVGALRGTGARELVVDVRDRQRFVDVMSVVPVDAVVHQLTALRRPPLTRRSMRETNRLRSEGTSTLIAGARAAGAKKFVAASVAYGYGFRDHGEAVLTETAPFGSSRGDREPDVQASLLSLEQQVRAFGGVSLRFGMFYSATTAPAPYPAEGDGVLPWVSTADAADAVVLALEKARPKTVFNIADDDPVSWRTMQLELAEAQGLARPRELRPWMLERVAPFAASLVSHTDLRVSSARARRTLGWTPRARRDVLGLQ
jgi:nucleoside-diphosphate-sugar epimerase